MAHLGAEDIGGKWLAYDSYRILQEVQNILAIGYSLSDTVNELSFKMETYVHNMCNLIAL